MDIFCCYLTCDAREFFVCICHNVHLKTHSYKCSTAHCTIKITLFNFSTSIINNVRYCNDIFAIVLPHYVHTKASYAR